MSDPIQSDQSPRNDAHQKAFLDAFLEHQSRLFAYIAMMLPRPDQAEEVFGQVSLVLWKKWGHFDPTSDFLAWARAVAHNEVRNFVRRRANSDIHLGEQVVDILEKSRAEQNDEMDRRREILNECLEGLVKEERELLERHYHRREPVGSIAESYGISPSTVYTRLHRIRQFLHECVKDRLAAEAV